MGYVSELGSDCYWILENSTQQLRQAVEGFKAKDKKINDQYPEQQLVALNGLDVILKHVAEADLKIQSQIK